MADVVNEALRGNWMSVPDESGTARFDVEGFLDNNLDFAGREFDVILLWTTLDYIPNDLGGPADQAPALLHASWRPGVDVLPYSQQWPRQ